MDLPTGTVTFLFTDIEGSTRLLQQLGDGYRDVLEAHAAIIRDRVAAHQGMVVSTEGDAFFCVFASATAAVAAAADILRGLSAHAWPPGVALKVRAGLHTGEGQRGGDDYVGIDVHRAARVAGAGHGGQIVLTSTTRELAAPTLPDGLTLRDLGRHRLKDLIEPEHLFQLIVAGLPAAFPPLRSIDARPNNLPADITSFVGRQAEVAAVLELLARNRVVTLTGPGGTGKTRLSRRVAWEALASFEDGAWFVDLSAITDASLVASAIGSVLNVLEQPDIPIGDALKSFLAPRHVLLVLDNFEQVTDAASVVAELIAAAPRLVVLATSRIPLHIYGEQEYPVPPLGLPAGGEGADGAADLDAVTNSESVRLFVERARAARPDFRLGPDDAACIAAIVARLDGLPLAIELAAARVKLLPPRALSERLDRSLTLLASTSSDLPPRQRTLRGAIDWSYDLLDEPDRDLFGRLAVFMGGFTLPIAEQVTGAALDGRPELDVMTGVESLLDKSLLRASQADHASEVRLLMLETIREYATERLTASGMTHLLRRRHAESYIALAEAAEPHLLDKEQRAWLERLTSEHDNIRAALAWAIEAEEPVCGLRIGGAVWRFWHQRGHLREGHEWLKRLMAMPGADADARVRVRALIADGGLVYWLRDYDGAFDRYNEALRLATANGDDQGAADATYNLIWIYGIRGDTETGLAMFDDAERRYRALGDELGSTRMRLMAGIQTYLAGDWIRARQDFEQARDRFEALGQRYELGDIEVGIGETYLNTGEPRRALAEYEAGLQVFAEAGNLSGIAMALQSVSVATLEMGEPGTAVRFAGAAHRIEERLGGSAPRELARVFFGPEQRARAIAAIGDDAFERSWEEGRSMDVVDAQALLRDLAMTSD